MPHADAPAGRHFRFRDFFEAGETWRRHRPSNVPLRAETYAAITELCARVIDPLVEKFGEPTLTYGFASAALTRLVGGRIDPSRDQHAGHELNARGRPICPRFGQAADLLFPAAATLTIARWIVRRLDFDRLYVYEPGRPVHVSVGPQHARAVVLMLPGPSGRRLPRVIEAGKFLELDWDGSTAAGKARS